MLLIFLALINVSYSHAVCNELNIGGEKMTINKDGQVEARGAPLPSADVQGKEIGSTITTFQYPAGKTPKNPNLALRNIFQIERDMRKRATSITTSHMYWDTKKEEEVKPPPGHENEVAGTMRFQFAYDPKTSECHLDRSIMGQWVIYDAKFCGRLSKSLEKMTDNEMGKCNTLLREMAEATHSFKKELAGSNLYWRGQANEANAWVDILADAATCRAPVDPFYDQDMNLKKFPIGIDPDTKQ